MTAAAARADRRSADREAVLVASDRFETSLTSATSSVAGVDALAVDGRVDPEEFEVFATDVALVSGLPALAFVELVPERDRAQWEASTGSSMQDTDGAGGFLPAAARPTHAVVRYAAPVNETTRGVIGFDLLSDPVRASGVEAATASSAAQLVGPISTVTEAAPGLFLTAPVRDASGALVGFVACGISLDDAAHRVGALESIDDIGVAVDGAVLLDGGDGRATHTFQLAGRTFTVTASNDRPANWLPTAALTGLTAVLFAASARALRRDRRERQRDRRAAERSQRLSVLAEELVNASNTLDTARLAVDHAGVAVGARHTNVGVRSVSDPSKLHVVHDTDMSADLADRFMLQSVGDDLPLAEAARTGRTVWIPDRDEYAARYPHVLDHVVAAGIHAVCCVPLSLGDDPHAGVIGFAFDRPLTARDRAEIEAAATVIAQMTGRALDRARVRELIQQRVDLLADLARQLTTVRSSADVVASVTEMVPALLDVDRAAVTTTLEGTEAQGTHAYRCTVDDRLVLEHDPRRVWAPIDETLAATIADLVGGALTRTRLHDQERAVLQRFQDSLLMQPPEVPGFDIAVGYRSALTAVGMGGDWYSVIDTPTEVYAVIGDVAGHGPGAVALMAEIKTVVRHLLSSATPMAAAVGHADRTLRRRNALASMLVVRISKERPELTYVNAGHPPALIYTGTGVVALDDVHRPWLGVDTDSPASSSGVRFDVGDVLLMYTDGLVEQRGETIDDSIRTRLHHVDTTRRLDEVVEHLLTSRQLERNAETVDDDIALVALRRTSTPTPDRAVG